MTLANRSHPSSPRAFELNARAARLAESLVADATVLGAAVRRIACGATLIDLGIEAPGGLAAGLRLAEICLSGLGRVEFVPAGDSLQSGLAVATVTDHPVAACMASQYAGWQITAEKFFAMGSGPMRAAAGKEPLFEKIGCRERPDVAVGVLETRKLPSDEVCRTLAADAGVPPERLWLLAAPTASLAGMVQIVARSVETALHKLVELGFDVGRVRCGAGRAPLPPPAADDLAALGVTNDAILYGADVTLWIDADEAVLRQIGPQIPSSASPDHGKPFAEIFARAGHDFYQIDPLLFSPARVTLASLTSGGRQVFGQIWPEILEQSFGDGE